MDSPLARKLAPRAAHELPRRGRDAALVLLLLVLAGAIRTWVFCHTEVVARDGITFIGYALELEKKPWQDVLRHNVHHPGYPLSVLAVSVPVRYMLGRTDCDSMQWSAQLASALAGVLLVMPMFLLGKELFDRPVAFWATLIFQCLPAGGRVLSDALSEPLFLLWMVSALYCAVRAIRSKSTGLFAGCGLCGGLAYVTRPEGILVLIATLFLLMLMQLISCWRRPWRWSLASATCLTLGAMSVANPYMAVVKNFTNKPSKHLYTVVSFGGRTNAATSTHPRLGLSTDSHLLAVSSVSRLPLGSWFEMNLPSSKRLGRSLWLLVRELGKGFHYFVWLPALLGLWWSRHRWLRRPEAWLILVLCLVYLTLLWRLASVTTYVSERHVLLPVLCGLYLAVAGICQLAGRISAWWRQRFPALADSCRTGKCLRLLTGAPTWSVVLLLALAGSGLPKTFQRLHANRAGHRAAGEWLALHARPADKVCDGHFGWASYYAGRLFLERSPTPNASVSGHVLYIVKGSSKERENPYGPTNAKADYTVEAIRAAGGKIVWHWPAETPVARAKVVIWAVRLPANFSENLGHGQ